jgi:hypothetical protein
MTQVILRSQADGGAGASSFDRKNAKASRVLAERTLDLLAREGQTPAIREEATRRLDAIKRGELW